MVKHRKDNRGTGKVSRPGIVYFVRSLFVALDSGLVHLPKHLYHFERAIRQALNGNLEPLERALAMIAARSRYVEDKDEDSEIMTKWKGGMAGFYLNQHVLLEKFCKLMKQYNKAITNDTLTVSEEAFGRDSIECNQAACVREQADIDNYLASQRREI